MTKLDRFSQLEPPRDDAATEQGAAQPTPSARFAAIEAPAAAQQSTDPFAPTTNPADEVPLQLVHEEPSAATEARKRKRDRANAELAEHVTEMLRDPPRGPAKPALLEHVARLRGLRMPIIGGAVALMILSPTLGPWTWFVGPAIVALVGASYFVTRR